MDICIKITTWPLSDYGKRSLAGAILELLENYGGVYDGCILNDSEVEDWAQEMSRQCAERK